MDVLKLFSWEHSLEAIEQLETLLQCNICKEMAADPQCLGRCDHFFCSGCIRNVENICPICKIPAPPCEIKPDRIISGLISSSKDLRNLIDGGQIEGISPGLEAPADIHCSPERQKRSSIPLQNVTPQSPANSSIKNQTINTSHLNDSKMKNKKGGQNQGKIKKGSLCNNKVGKKVKPALKHDETRSNSSGRKSPTQSAVNSSNTKPDKSLPVIPVTPECKKLLKLPDQSVLGKSPISMAINKRNTKGETALHIACIKGENERVLHLLGEGANPNTKDNAGWTPLHEACSHGFQGIAELLLQHGAIVDVPAGSNENPLHDAVSQGQVELVKLLRSWGASDTARNLFGRTPRSLASLCVGVTELNNALDTPVDTSLKRPEVMKPLLNRIVLSGCGLSTEQTRILDNLAKELRARMVTDFSPEVTHIIANCMTERIVHQRTLKYMMGVVSGKWILSHTWMDDCVSQEVALNPQPYEVLGSTHNTFSCAPKKARINAEIMRPGLFNGCHMFLWGNFSDPYPSRKELETLIKAGGGIVLAREPNPESIPEKEQTVPFHSNVDDPLGNCSHYILYQEGNSEPQIKYDMAHIKSLPLIWLYSCIERFQLLPPFI